MITQSTIKSGEYHDSVTLLGVAQSLANADGIIDAAVVMGTLANKEILGTARLLTEQVATASPNDLIIAVTGETLEHVTAALELADHLLKTTRPISGATETQPIPRTLAAGMQQLASSNIVLISVAGRYATSVAHDALMHNQHVFLFSDNVTLEDEIKLKKLAHSKGLLVMGPDAGTSIINGAALGFANNVLRGPVGIVAASGTGLQSVTSQLSRKGIGISQAIGVGGRDLSRDVGGIMMTEGYQALLADSRTDVVVLISKPPAPKVSQKILKQVATSAKPTVVCFLGSDGVPILEAGGIPATTLEEAALIAASIIQDKVMDSVQPKLKQHHTKLKRQAKGYKSKLNKQQKYYRGLFSGGTFCYETQLILSRFLGKKNIFSNTPVYKKQKLIDENQNTEHTAIDFGADEYTVGRLHPMLDPSLRNRRLIQAAVDPQTAVIYFDIVLGYGVHPDPAGAVIPVIQQAQAELKQLGREIIFTASVCGTPNDPQDAAVQVDKLRQTGVIVLRSNASAAYLAGYILA